MKKLFIGIIIALAICTVVGVVAKVTAPDTLITSRKTYEVVADVSHGEMGDLSKLKKGSSVIVTLEAAEGYALPETITVTGATYEYDQTTGNLTLSNPVGQVAIEVVCVPITYTVSTTLTNGTSSGATSIIYSGTATVTLAASSGYTLPSSVTVTGATYTYDSTTGVVSLSAPTGNVTITGACTANTYAITTSVTNATASGDTTIATGGTASVTLTAVSGYTLPSTVTVTNATLDSYTGGVVTISNPLGDVTISGACDQVQQREASYTVTISADGEQYGTQCYYEVYINTIGQSFDYYMGYSYSTYDAYIEDGSGVDITAQAPIVINDVSVIYYNQVGYSHSGSASVTINGTTYNDEDFEWTSEEQEYKAIPITANSTIVFHVLED